MRRNNWRKDNWRYNYLIARALGLDVPLPRELEPQIAPLYDLVPKGACGFLPPFGAPFQAPVATPGGAVTPWYLAGGIAASACVAAYCPKGSSSLAASYTNLANPGTYDAAPGTAPTFNAATGWTFNGSTQYLTTGITPATGQTWSAIAQFSGCTITDDRALFGGNGQPNTYYFGLWVASGGTVWYDNAQELSASAAIASGNLCVAGNHGYINGVLEAGTIADGGRTGVTTLYIGAYNSNGTTANYFMSGTVNALAIYDTVITPSQITALVAAMAAL